MFSALNVLELILKRNFAMLIIWHCLFENVLLIVGRA